MEDLKPGPIVFRPEAGFLTQPESSWIMNNPPQKDPYLTEFHGLHPSGYQVKVAHYCSGSSFILIWNILCQIQIKFGSSTNELDWSSLDSDLHPIPKGQSMLVDQNLDPAVIGAKIEAHIELIVLGWISQIKLGKQVLYLWASLFWSSSNSSQPFYCVTHFDHLTFIFCELGKGKYFMYDVLVISRSKLQTSFNLDNSTGEITLEYIQIWCFRRDIIGDVLSKIKIDKDIEKLN